VISTDNLAAGLDACLLTPFDDVATAARDLAPGTVVHVRAGDVTRDVTLAERIAAGHKLAVRPLAAGLRIRKYGEYIGRTTAAVAAGAWVHDHNLETVAHRAPDLERAWHDARPADARPVGAARCALGESPVWREGRLWYVDLRDTPAIHALDPSSGREQCWPMPEEVGFIVPAHDGTLLAGLRSGFAAFDPARGGLDYLLDPEPGLPGNRLNDGKCDARGRVWCGSMNHDSALAEGTLYVVDGAGCRAVQGGWLTPNGMTWSADERTLYVADTRRGTIDAFAFDAERGTLGERSLFADLGTLPGGPDGATLDAEGFLWSAIFDAGCLLRLDPAGRVDRMVRLPVSKPASCTFGGDDLATLYVTTASRGLSPARLAAEPLAGRVLALDVGVRGRPARVLAPDVLRALKRASRRVDTGARA
jgi:sugar lactone lactonase YvrE